MTYFNSHMFIYTFGFQFQFSVKMYRVLDQLLRKIMLYNLFFYEQSQTSPVKNSEFRRRRPLSLDGLAFGSLCIYTWPEPHFPLILLLLVIRFRQQIAGPDINLGGEEALRLLRLLRGCRGANVGFPLRCANKDSFYYV